MTDTNIDAGVSNEALADTTNSEALDTETTEQTDLPDGEQPTEETEPTEEEKAKTEQVKKQKALDARFAELTRKQKEAERRADAAEERLRAQAPVSTEAPKIDDFDSLESWQQAVQQHAVQSAKSEAINTYKQQQAQVRFQETQRRIEVQEQAFAVAHPDYSEVSQRVTSMFGGQFPQHLAEAIADSDNAPALAYELGRDAQGLIDFLEMSPVAQLKRIGAIEANLSTSKPQSKPIPKPPAPINPVKPNASANRDPSKMSDGEWLTHRNAQLKKGK